VVNDKYATAAFARRHGLPYPETAASREEAEALIRRTGFPLICKPRAGFAQRGVTIVRNRCEAEAALARSGFILQEYLCPPADLDDILADMRYGAPLLHRVVEHDHYSGQALVGADGTMLAFFASLLDKGEIGVVTPIDAPALRKVTSDYVRHLGALGYVGPLNLNCKQMPDGSFIPYELNGRFTGTSATRAMLGYPEVALAIAHFLDGQPVDDLPPGPLDRIVVWPRGRTLVQLRDVDELHTAGVWRRRG
jgi:carbamoyl-phosphate synthase large subunit